MKLLSFTPDIEKSAFQFTSRYEENKRDIIKKERSNNDITI